MAGEFLDLVDPSNTAKVVLGIEKAVVTSFEQDKQPGRIILVTGLSSSSRETPREEAKRRMAICIKIFKELRGDLSWGIDRILDHLPEFLRMTLDGQAWEPVAKRATWAGTQK